MLLSEPLCVWPAGAALGEGALWSPREQALYWVDILSFRLHCWRPSDGSRSTWKFDEEISALAERRDAPGLLITLRRGFALFDPAQPDHPPTYLHQPEPELTGNRFNDGKCDARGRFWAGTMDVACEAPTGSLYCYQTDRTNPLGRFLRGCSAALGGGHSDRSAWLRRAGASRIYR